MASGRSTLLSIIKYYWDNFWKESGVMLILCGSIASFMVQKVLHSKALYGRIGLEILLKGLKPDEVTAFFNNKKSNEEILKYILIIGTIPKYLEYINQSRSFSWNVNNLLFSKHGKMFEEINNVFYSQFKETSYYHDIVDLLKNRLYSFDEISKKVNLATGGGLKRYLDNLENAEIVKSYVPFNRKITSKLKRYTLIDEYLRFHFKYIEPNYRFIVESDSGKLFEVLTKKSFDVWMGFQFEKFCIKNSSYIAEIMGFKDEVLLASPYFEKNDETFQIDLLYQRSDNVVTVCEIKYWSREVGTKIISDMKRKLELLKIPRGYSLETALISLYGPDEALKDTNYFDHIVTLEDIFYKK